jgi:hypothetical protein
MKHFGPCAKQRVIALITAPSGHYYIGANDCLKPQKHCPRGNMPTGIGYHLCKEVCEQIGHAEHVAASIYKALDGSPGATMYLIGHTYMCDACKEAALVAGVDKFYIIDKELV